MVVVEEVVEQVHKVQQEQPIQVGAVVEVELVLQMDQPAAKA
jgi:hypothetical protein